MFARPSCPLDALRPDRRFAYTSPAPALSVALAEYLCQTCPMCLSARLTVPALVIPCPVTFWQAQATPTAPPAITYRPRPSPPCLSFRTRRPHTCPGHVARCPPLCRVPVPCVLVSSSPCPRTGPPPRPGLAPVLKPPLDLQPPHQLAPRRQAGGDPPFRCFCPYR